jgi:hypothetical protein
MNIQYSKFSEKTEVKVCLQFLVFFNTDRLFSLQYIH